MEQNWREKRCQCITGGQLSFYGSHQLFRHPLHAGTLEHLTSFCNTGQAMLRPNSILPLQKTNSNPNCSWNYFLLLWKKKWSHFDLKSRVSGGTNNSTRDSSKWRIFESNWLSISSQFDSNILQFLGIPGRILVPPVTQLYRSKWLHLSSLIFLCDFECPQCR